MDLLKYIYEQVLIAWANLKKMDQTLGPAYNERLDS